MFQIIFVLRKKDSQITNLHVIHHSIVPISVWIAVKYAPGGNNSFFPFLNSGIHTVMYFYYGLSAFGPSIQKYLWWKKYLTTLQLVQFILVMLHGLMNFIHSCEFPRSFIVLNVSQAVLFFYLFLSFYRKSYKKSNLPSKLNSNFLEIFNSKATLSFSSIIKTLFTSSLFYNTKCPNLANSNSSHYEESKKLKNQKCQ